VQLDLKIRAVLQMAQECKSADNWTDRLSCVVVFLA